jgi:hypothetical protein
MIDAWILDNLTPLTGQPVIILRDPQRMIVSGAQAVNGWAEEHGYTVLFCADSAWRPPANEEERQQKAALRSSDALRCSKRFANDLLDSVPPAERDKLENAIILADWVRHRVCLR